VPTEDRSPELLLRELGQINTELAAQRRESAMTAHDLANPAQVILGLCEILLDHQHLDPIVRRRVEQIHRSAVTMSTLISDLSSGLALDDRTNQETRRVNLGELVTSLVDRTRLLADAKDMDVRYIRKSGGQGCWVDGDAVKLERALANLLSNAIKFSPPTSMVSVTLDWGSTLARIAVADQGPGISDVGHARIFEVFHREASNAHLPGLGLGLYIAKQIVESHGGTITVASEAGRGAAFELQIPLAVDVPLAGLG
jgi:signal transduction histidine kinase